jgi:hypothetical protein
VGTAQVSPSRPVRSRAAPAARGLDPDWRFYNFTALFPGRRASVETGETKEKDVLCGQVVVVVRVSGGGGAPRAPLLSSCARLVGKERTGGRRLDERGERVAGPAGEEGGGGAHARPRAAAGFSPRPAGRPDPKPRSTPIMRARASVAARPRRHGTARHGTAPSPPLAAVAGTGESRPPAAGLTPRREIRFSPPRHVRRVYGRRSVTLAQAFEIREPIVAFLFLNSYIPSINIKIYRPA